MKREAERRRKGSIKEKRNFGFFSRRKKSDRKKGKSMTNLYELFSIPITEKSSINYTENSGIKTVIFYCFKKALIRH